MRIRDHLHHVVVLVSAILAVTSCARVTPHISLPPLVLGEPSFFPTFEAYTVAPIVSGNSVTVLLNGDEIFPAVLDAIRKAEQTINYAQYYYEDGPAARDIAHALAERCRAGVIVNILLDGFGSLNMPSEYRQVMESSGCHVAYSRPITPGTITRLNNRNHRRILVVDGIVGFTGGSGVGRKWMGNGREDGHWRDTDVRVEGPVVEHLQGAFAESWLEATGIVLGGTPYFSRPLQQKGTVYAQVVRSSPAGGSYAMYTMFLLAMASARRSISITNPYFVLDDKMTQVLTQAVNRGVRVVVLVPGEIDHNIVRHASRGQFGRLLKAGIEIHEYKTGLLHAKTMVVDGVWSTIGSTNLDNRSFALNDELNIVLYNRSVGQNLEKIFADDLSHSRKIELRHWRARGLLDRILETLAIPLRDQL